MNSPINTSTGSTIGTHCGMIQRMLGVSGIVVQLIGDTLRWWRLTFRSTQSLKAENLFLRPQLALYVEHGMKPRRIDPVTRISLAILSRFFNCGSVCSKSVLGGLHHEYSLCPA